MAKIKSIKGRQVFDSRGNPTVEAEIFLDDGSTPFSITDWRNTIDPFSCLAVSVALVAIL